MARNRKYQSAAIRFGPVLKTFLLCLLIGGAGVGYVWQKERIYQLGQQIGKGEMRLRELTLQNEKLRKELGRIRSPRVLEERIQKLGLGLVPPHPARMLRLIEPSRDCCGPEAERQYAAPRQATHEPRS
jgi:hypothetical protein